MTSSSFTRVLMAVVLMTMLMPLALWIPVAGPLGAGLIGGFVARSAGLAVLAVLLLSAVPVGVSTLAGYFSTGYALVGAGIGALTAMMIFTLIAPLTLGALVGGFLSASGPGIKTRMTSINFPWKAR